MQKSAYYEVYFQTFCVFDNSISGPLDWVINPTRRGPFPNIEIDSIQVGVELQTKGSTKSLGKLIYHCTNNLRLGVVSNTLGIGVVSYLKERIQ